MENDIAHVNVSCANIYRKSTFHSEIDTQAVLWEKLQILDQSGDFVLVNTEDDYKGWINSHQIYSFGMKKRTKWELITEPIVTFYENSQIPVKVVRDGFAGIKIPIIEENGNWVNTSFPDKSAAWLDKEKLQTMNHLTRENFINYAKRFMGTPYFWGGKTPKGFDCSGFAQFVHKMFDIRIRRDSWMQFDDAEFVSENLLEGQAGDLMFFAEGGDRITHVGFCLANGYILHSRGMVRINSLLKTDPQFDESLFRDFVGIKTFLKV